MIKEEIVPASKYVKINIGNSLRTKREAIEANFGRRAIITYRNLGSKILEGPICLFEGRNGRTSSARFGIGFKPYRSIIDYEDLIELLVRPKD
ncbi:MAG: hypothetical protein WC533_02835 [Candidatus Pacearchaeota archaeon]